MRKKIFCFFIVFFSFFLFSEERSEKRIDVDLPDFKILNNSGIYSTVVEPERPPDAIIYNEIEKNIQAWEEQIVFSMDESREKKYILSWPKLAKASYYVIFSCSEDINSPEKAAYEDLVPIKKILSSTQMHYYYSTTSNKVWIKAYTEEALLASKFLEISN